ncbi:MAG: mobile mystery protein A [Bacteroidia bacterium]|nr:mobile mystery protein A [Bacteroidia bacterium]MCC6837800.1 mobile mystery protein A [Bacteroidia bacterium]
MKNNKQNLVIEQVDRKLSEFKVLEQAVIPADGWIHTVRVALKMSLRQMGKRLGITSQSVKEIEQREANGSITLKTLREAGNALDLKLVYGFVPRNSSIEKMIEDRAYELAQQIVKRTSTTMKLEDQENSLKRLDKATQMKVKEIIETMPKYLWD